MGEGGESASFATVTHARLRLAQGDAGGAVRILEAILRARPGDEEARHLLRSLGRAEPRPVKQDSRTASRARLARWIDLVRRNRGAGDVR